MQLKLATCSDDYKCKLWKTQPSNILEAKSDGLPVFSGEVSWNEEADSYLRGKPFESKIHYTHSSKVYIENKSKRKLFSDVLENDENECTNSQQSKKSKTEGELQKNILRFAAYPTSFPNQMTNVLVSPRKISNASNSILQSPKKINITPKKLKKLSDNKDAIFSPTGNLPNIILDGRSPHEKLFARTFSTGKKIGKSNHKVDWLTEMSQQKKNSLPKKHQDKQQQSPIGLNNKDNIYSMAN